MATLRVHRASLAEVVQPTLRVHRAALTGGTVVIPTVRIHRASLSGTVAVVVAPLPDHSDVEPETPMTVTASLIDPIPGEVTWVWRVVSGAVTLVPSGSSVQFRAPSGMPPGGSATLGATATVEGTTSLEEVLTVTTLPQTRWWYTPGGFVGRRPAQYDLVD